METLVKSAETKTTWNLDPTHSNLEFSVRHMMISTVKGHFGTFNVKAEAEGLDFSKANVEVEIDVNSIYTGQENREGHLKSPDFFDAANFPTATFKTSSIEKTDDEGNLKMTGDLTIRGTTKPVVVNVEYTGAGTDPYGNEKAGFEFSTTVNRTDFGLNWNVPLESGGVLVSQNVKIFGSLQLVKQKEA